MNRVHGTAAEGEQIWRRGRVVGSVWSGFAAECMMSIYMGSSGVCILQHMAQGWPRCSACTIRGIDWGTMFGNNLRRESCLSERASESESRKKDSHGGSDWYWTHLAYEGGGRRCIGVQSMGPGGWWLPQFANEGSEDYVRGLRCA